MSKKGTLGNQSFEQQEVTFRLPKITTNKQTNKNQVTELSVCLKHTKLAPEMYTAVTLAVNLTGPKNHRENESLDMAVRGFLD